MSVRVDLTNVRAHVTTVRPDVAIGAAHRHRVLLVHEDDDAREAMAVLLTSRRIRVRATSNGTTALAVLRAGFAPCVVLFDRDVLDMDAAAFRAEQTCDHGSRGVPTVLLDGVDSTKRIEGGGAGHRIRWVVDPRRLSATVDTHCRREASRGGRALAS